ncbi:MAG: DinB family protein [Gemmatimonadaceae bacterium]|nr:DinB family protein [Gemmatimonadaceae bacterium]
MTGSTHAAAMRDAVLRQYRATHDGDPWYGSSRVRLLRGISSQEAAATPIDDAPSIWALVLHMTAWTEEVLRRLNGAEPTDPERGDWPDVPDVTERAWKAAKHDLAQAHLALCDAIASATAAQLARPVGKDRDPALGTGVNVVEMLIGLLQHDAYHIGQIASVRRALRAG